MFKEIEAQDVAQEIAEKSRLDVAVDRMVRAIRPIFPETTFNHLLTDINKKKQAHYFLSAIFHKFGSPELLINIYRNKWGDENLIDYSYNKVIGSLDKRACATLLSLLMSERRILAQERGLLKHLTVAIVGLKGSGKTTYSVVSSGGALMLSSLFKMSESEVADILSNLVFFEPENFVEFVRFNLLENKEWVPMVVLDDVGGQISKYWIHIGEKYWSYLFSVLDHLKDWCGVLVLTATSFSAIPARLRDIVDIVVEASEIDVNGYIMDLFVFFRRDKYLPGARKTPIYIDVAPPTLLMPDKLWDKMINTRRELGQKRLDRVLDEIKKAKTEMERKRIRRDREDFDIKIKEYLEEEERRRKDMFEEDFSDLDFEEEIE
ncbi:MAG: hypothetical protein QXT67_04720 [Candidatus Bathyarchaeia archaeon]